ncbi:hypothetical protein I7I48_11843 [Histoplasma ohiense]|nr:hypothetical protein I7I48_11843 [Histoplasma ohiense (nom. inval.)]
MWMWMWMWMWMRGKRNALAVALLFQTNRVWPRSGLVGARGGILVFSRCKEHDDAGFAVWLLFFFFSFFFLVINPLPRPLLFFIFIFICSPHITLRNTSLGVDSARPF